jgi:hypothetical protein
MPDPTGSIGMAPQRPNDIDIALVDGAAFAARLKQLSDQRDAAANALADLKLGEAAKDAFEKAEQMKAAAADAYVKAGHDLADAARKADEARATARAIIAEAAARSADADKRLASAEQAELDLMKERARVRAVEKAAATTKKDYEVKKANLQAKIERLIAEMTA